MSALASALQGLREKSAGNQGFNLSNAINDPMSAIKQIPGLVMDGVEHLRDRFDGPDTSQGGLGGLAGKIGETVKEHAPNLDGRPNIESMDRTDCWPELNTANIPHADVSIAEAAQQSGMSI